MQWYYRSDVRPCGPFTFDELRALYRAGALGGDTPVWHDGQTVGTTAAALLSDPVVPPRRPIPGREVPSTQDRRESLVGLGGWLTFYSIGYGISVLWAGVLVLLLASTAVTGSAYGSWHDWPVPPWVILAGEAANLAVAYLYFTRSTAWPSASIAANVLAAVVLRVIMAGERDAPPVWVLVGAVTLHTAYVLSSAHVRDTFVVQPARTLTEALERRQAPGAARATLWVGVGLLAVATVPFYPVLTAVCGAAYLAYRIYTERT
ncbi:MAG TPA: DUF4339 domain-containing protein [Rubricoccaceae bacterium]